MFEDFTNLTDHRSLGCVLLTDQSTLPDPDLILLRLVGKHKFNHFKRFDDKLFSGSNAWSITVDETYGGVVAYPEHFPDETIKRAGIISSSWRTAAIDCRHVKHQIIVTTYPHQNTPIYKAYLELTRVVEAVIAESKIVGVYWAMAPKVMRANDFVMMAESVPELFACWVEFITGTDKSGCSYACTVGMKQFDLKEMEFESRKYSREDLILKAMIAGINLVMNGQAFKSGQKIAESASNEFTNVSERKSRLPRDEQVMHFEL
jgi:hypothetical protein